MNENLWIAKRNPQVFVVEYDIRAVYNYSQKSSLTKS